MQVRRCREEGSETPGIRMSVVSHRKASGTNDLPPIHALPGDEGPVESARSNQVAGISGPESRRLRPLAPTMAVATWHILIGRFAFMQNMTQNPSGV